MINVSTVPVDYLAGGMKGNRQVQVKEAVQGVSDIDPHDVATAGSQSAHTLAALRQLPLSELRGVLSSMSAEQVRQLEQAATQDLEHQVRDFPRVQLGDLAICGFPEGMVHTLAGQHVQ